VTNFPKDKPNLLRLPGQLLSLKLDGFAKNPKTVMPDSIRHPEAVGIAEFRLSPE